MEQRSILVSLWIRCLAIEPRRSRRPIVKAFGWHPIRSSVLRRTLRLRILLAWRRILLLRRRTLRLRMLLGWLRILLMRWRSSFSSDPLKRCDPVIEASTGLHHIGRHFLLDLRYATVNISCIDIERLDLRGHHCEHVLISRTSPCTCWSRWACERANPSKVATRPSMSSARTSS